VKFLFEVVSTFINVGKFKFLHALWRHIPEYNVLHCHCWKNLMYCTARLYLEFLCCCFHISVDMTWIVLDIVFWDVMSWSLVGIYRRAGGTSIIFKHICKILFELLPDETILFFFVLFSKQTLLRKIRQKGLLFYIYFLWVNYICLRRSLDEDSGEREHTPTHKIVT
jgi:hypothetical protein